MSNVLAGDVFVIESLHYFPLGASNPVFNRPYVVSSTGGAINTIVDRVQENKSGSVNSAIVGELMSSLIQPNVVGEASVVNNDWVGTRRYVFILKVKSIDAIGNETLSYFQGYTQYDGINEPTGSIDTKMVHFINNVIETTALTIQTPLGLIRKEKLVNVYNVFSSMNQEYYTQRPTDVIENISLTEATQFLNDNGADFSSFNIGNTINPFNRNIISSTVGNGVTSEFLCRVINGGVQKQKEQQIFLGGYEVQASASPSIHLLEPSINDNRFAKYLSRLGGFMTVTENFTFDQLISVDPTIYDRFILLRPNNNYVNPLILNTPEVGDYWHGQDPVTLKAYSIIESSVSLAMKYGFNKLYFTASNMVGPMTSPTVMITNFDSMLNLDDNDMAFLLETFKSKFITDIFIGESNAGTLPLHIDMYVDLLGTSKVYLEYAGYQGNWYTIPTPASSLFSPVTTISDQTLSYVTEQFGSMINEIVSGRQQASNFY